MATMSTTLAMAIPDAGSWHFEFNAIVRRVRESLLKLAELTAGDGFEAILMRLEGVPGFSFIIARRTTLQATSGYARSLSLDLLDQLLGFEANGQFRFTPPTHAILAFDHALRELDQVGGVAARGRRYATNHWMLLAGMRRLGFTPFLDAAIQSFIITAFHSPPNPAFRFSGFYHRLSNRGMIIYPGKLCRVDTFRIGTIGRLFETDIAQLLHAIEDVLRDISCTLPLHR